MRVSFKGNENISTTKPRDWFREVKADLAAKTHRPGYRYKTVDMPYDDVMIDKRNLERGYKLSRITNLTDRELKNFNTIGHMKNARAIGVRGDMIRVEREIPAYKELIKIGFTKMINAIKAHIKK